MNASYSQSHDVNDSWSALHRFDLCISFLFYLFYLFTTKYEIKCLKTCNASKNNIQYSQWGNIKLLTIVQIFFLFFFFETEKGQRKHKLNIERKRKKKKEQKKF